MVKGTMGIIGCPVLEDEIIYSLSRENDDKNIYVIDTPPSSTLTDKLGRAGIPFTAVGEWEFNNGYAEIDRDRGFNIVIMMNKLGLHARPEFLRQTIEDQLRFCQNRFDVIALYYGMCGNAGWDVSKWASETLDIPVFVFRDMNGEVCDDCIGVAIGGHSRYCDFVRKYPGMLYVTPSMAGNWDRYAEELDFCKGFEIMDIHTVKEVFQVFGYSKAVKIDTGLGARGEEFENGCRHVSDETGLELVVPEPGSVDLYPTERIYMDAKGALRP
ncbi:MAG: DUF1638 domain-containing protein [Candidatus Methanoplasma sp.]|jgi:hypothetical protein|nr:DUF1638 domain-containing protein [Candidatus Methanoplasma sp.]